MHTGAGVDVVDRDRTVAGAAQAQAVGAVLEITKYERALRAGTPGRRIGRDDVRRARTQGVGLHPHAGERQPEPHVDPRPDGAEGWHSIRFKAI